jgi:hypothetical protein
MRARDISPGIFDGPGTVFLGSPVLKHVLVKLFWFDEFCARLLAAGSSLDGVSVRLGAVKVQRIHQPFFE